MLQKVKIVIRGVVQGVGFRPFIYRLATQLNIKGWIINSSQGVFIEAEAERELLDIFISRIKSDKPKNSYIQSFENTWLDTEGFSNFEIRNSLEEGSKTALVLPDISTCKDCLGEIFDPANRRYLYPFTNCTNCGPRFSIIDDLPYDRANTTMGEFEMCDECRAEYTNPLDRRFHAEPTACPVCGPQVSLTDETGNILFEKHDAVLNAVKVIKEGKILALKGIGGYQLLCDASNDAAVKELRKRKRRSEKPFALMFHDLESILIEADVNEAEKGLLLSVEAPIVLLKRKKGIASGISDECIFGNPYLGIMLPYSPLHHILMKELGIPVVATSGNISEEPICINEEQAYIKLGDIADYFLVHNRKILRHVDDSILRISAGNEVMIRRARGYAPLPLVLENIENNTILAAGAHLKNTIALNKGSNVFVSQHIGDLENTESINAYKNVINDIKTFYELKPDIAVCDMHPDYISAKFSDSLNIPKYKVQHHYAHVLSCMAENRLDENVLGVSWDGTGYGTDGTIWGGEFIVPNGNEFKRAGYFKTFRLPGGESAIQDVWKIGYSLLYEVFGKEADKLDFLQPAGQPEMKIIQQMLEKNINSPVTSSCGRLFDGISAITGIKQHASFEAQAAMELEFTADDFNTNDYFAFSIDEFKGSLVFNWHNIIRDIVNDLKAGVPAGLISAKFHNTLAELIVQMAERLRFEKVLLTGGCFMNYYLLNRAVKRLQETGFKPYTQQRVPAGDGGISLGQIKYASYLKF
ncbi:MAG: acylphosphatase [Chlorobi bacterium OLB5]|nr:MAG: acylphosphatase [Chlorobi bacterium OLB5]